MVRVPVGVLALQGAFTKHLHMLSAAGACPLEVRTPGDLEKCSGLVIPGGESTAMRRQIAFIGLEGPLKAFSEHHPIFGTCAGLILMADMLAILDIEVQRNGYGRQNESFIANITHHLRPGRQSVMKAPFIRAPRILSCGSDVKVLMSHRQEPVVVQQGMHLGAAFHPELVGDDALHRYFLKLVVQPQCCGARSPIGCGL